MKTQTHPSTRSARWLLTSPAPALIAALALATGTGQAFAQAEAPPPNIGPEPTDNPVSASAERSPAALQPAAAALTNAAAIPVETAAAETGAGPADGLRLNFRNAPIELVLSHLSEAAGFIIELDTNVRGTVSVISSHPMTKEEAVDLLNSVLNRNGYAAIRTGRTLKIMDKATAKSSNNPVKYGNDPEGIPNNDEMVTQIIPIRFVEASQLVTDISPFVSPQATIIANQAGNSVIITDTQANIRHLAEIIKAIDSSAEDITEVKVFRLQHADPAEMATLLTGLFPDQTGTAQVPIRFGGRGTRGQGGFGQRGGFPGFGPFAAAMNAATGGANANPQTDRIKKRNQVVAVADPRTLSVVVTATKDLMEQITEMIAQLDQPGKSQRMEVIRINNADPNEVLAVLQDTVGATTTRNMRNNQTSEFQRRIQQNQQYNTTTGFGSTGFGNTRGMTGQRGGF